MSDQELIEAIRAEIERMDRLYGKGAYSEIKRLAALAADKLKEDGR